MAPNTLLNVSGANSNGEVQAGIGRFECADFVQMESMRLSGSRFARSSNRKVYTGNRKTTAQKAAALWHCNPSWNSGYSVARSECIFGRLAVCGPGAGVVQRTTANNPHGLACGWQWKLGKLLGPITPVKSIPVMSSDCWPSNPPATVPGFPSVGVSGVKMQHQHLVGPPVTTSFEPGEHGTT